jgi:hypothetical protein
VMTPTLSTVAEAAQNVFQRLSTRTTASKDKDQAPDTPELRPGGPAETTDRKSQRFSKTGKIPAPAFGRRCAQGKLLQRL